MILESSESLPLEGVLRLENAPRNEQPSLAMVPIFYDDLPGITHEPITLFADSTTTAGYIIHIICVQKIIVKHTHVYYFTLG